jgi:hypothetical protein
VIIFMGADEDVRTGKVHDMLSAAGFREVILDLHGGKSPPATHDQNTKQECADGSWDACGMTVTNGRCLAFGDASPSLDHRLLWFEIACSVAFGQQPLAMISAEPKKLKAKDPRLTNRCHEQAEAKFRILIGSIQTSSQNMLECSS